MVKLVINNVTITNSSVRALKPSYVAVLVYVGVAIQFTSLRYAQYMMQSESLYGAQRRPHNQCCIKF